MNNYRYSVSKNPFAIQIYRDKFWSLFIKFYPVKLSSLYFLSKKWSIFLLIQIVEDVFFSNNFEFVSILKLKSWFQPKLADFILKIHRECLGRMVLIWCEVAERITSFYKTFIAGFQEIFMLHIFVCVLRLYVSNFLCWGENPDHYDNCKDCPFDCRCLAIPSMGDENFWFTSQGCLLHWFIDVLILRIWTFYAYFRNIKDRMCWIFFPFNL